jgi:hypothetical protein
VKGRGFVGRTIRRKSAIRVQEVRHEPIELSESSRLLYSRNWEQCVMHTSNRDRSVVDPVQSYQRVRRLVSGSFGSFSERFEMFYGERDAEAIYSRTDCSLPSDTFKSSDSARVDSMRALLEGFFSSVVLLRASSKISS